MKINVRFSNPLLKSRDDLFSRCVRFIAEAAILSNQALIAEAKAKGRSLPALFSSGVRYQNEPENSIDECLDIPSILKMGFGDCLHLCCWRVAELRQAGEKAKIRVTRKRRKSDGKRIFHVQVRRGNGGVEDPSKILGM